MQPASYRRLSISLIVVWWARKAVIAAQQLAHGFEVTSVAQIATMVAIRFVVLVPLLTFLLRGSEERWVDLGLAPRPFFRPLLRGLGFGVAIFLIANLLVGGVVKAVLHTPETPETLVRLLRDPHDLPLWLFCTIIGGGFSEELLRIFILTRFERTLGRTGLVIAVVLETISFGLGHAYQGIGGMVGTAVTGLLFALIYLRRRCALDAMFAHAIFDLIGLAIGYAIYGQWH